MKKKGFTLVELLAVIAILALLVVIALPNVLKMFNEAKKDIFLSEVKTIYKESSKKYITESMRGNKLSYVSSNSKNSLDISSNESVKYCINMSENGTVTSMVALDGKYYIEYSGESDINKYTKENVKEADTNVKMICSSKIAKIIEEPKSKECSYGGKLENNVQYSDELYTYTYHPWTNGYWEVILKNKESTDKVETPFCNVIDGKNVKYANGLFKDSKASSIDLSKFNTTNIDNMENMFKNTSTEKIKGLEYFDTSSVTKMTSMFEDTNATNLELGSFDTSKVINMSYMFKNSKVTSIDLSNFDTSKVTNMYGMFMNASLNTLDLSSFDTSNVDNMGGIFQGLKATQLNIEKLNTNIVTNMSIMFADMPNIQTLDVSKLDTSSATNMHQMFSSNSATTIIGLENFNTSKVTTMYGMFIKSNVKKLDLSHFDTRNVTNMSIMFFSSETEQIDLSSFDTSKVTTMNRMFMGSNATTLDLSNFNTSNVTDMKWMFWGAKVKELDLTSFNTSKVSDMGGMFRGTTMNKLNLTSFDITNSDISYMFDGAKVTRVLVKNQEDLNKYKNSGSVLNDTKFYIEN